MKNLLVSFIFVNLMCSVGLSAVSNYSGKALVVIGGTPGFQAADSCWVKVERIEEQIFATAGYHLDDGTSFEMTEAKELQTSVRELALGAVIFIDPSSILVRHTKPIPGVDGVTTKAALDQLFVEYSDALLDSSAPGLDEGERAKALKESQRLGPLVEGYMSWRSFNLVIRWATPDSESPAPSTFNFYHPNSVESLDGKNLEELKQLYQKDSKRFVTLATESQFGFSCTGLKLKK